jgi:hypothetical protein
VSWMQDIRDGRPSDKPLFGCLFGHDWYVQQHNVKADDNPRVVFVIAWKQCGRCAKSKLIHILK